MGAALVLVTLCALSGGVNPEPATNNDLWDFTQGVRVLSHSRFDLPGYNPYDAFGKLSRTSIHPGRIYFLDGLGDGSVDFIEWETPQPVRVGRMRLYYGDDYPGNNWRNLKEFRLFGWNGQSGKWQLLLLSPTRYQVGTAMNEYRLDPSRTHRRFRGEFVRGPASDINQDGPWIDELDAFPPPMSATFVSQALPRSPLIAGRSYQARVRFRNTGPWPWEPGEVNVTVEERADRPDLSRQHVSLIKQVPPGGSAVCQFGFTAPRQPGTYEFQCRVRSRLDSIGKPSPLASFRVLPSPFLP